MLYDNVEKELEECKKVIAKQKEMLADRDTYISLLEAGNDPEGNAGDGDIFDIFRYNIVFVGGLPETNSKLEVLFCTADFVNDENIPIPQGIDIIVLLAEQINHALFYKWIRYARNNGIKLVYGGYRADSNTITDQVVRCL